MVNIFDYCWKKRKNKAVICGLISVFWKDTQWYYRFKYMTSLCSELSARQVLYNVVNAVENGFYWNLDLF